MAHIFISYDIQDTFSERCATWIAQHLHGVEVILPQPCWTLGAWTHYLEQVMRKAEKIIVVLTPSYLTTTDRFVRQQCTLAQQMPLRLLVIHAGHCQGLLSETSVFSNVSSQLDCLPVVQAEESFRRLLFERFYHSL